MSSPLARRAVAVAGRGADESLRSSVLSSTSRPGELASGTIPSLPAQFSRTESRMSVQARHKGSISMAGNFEAVVPQASGLHAGVSVTAGSLRFRDVVLEDAFQRQRFQRFASAYFVPLLLAVAVATGVVMVLSLVKQEGWWSREYVGGPISGLALLAAAWYGLWGHARHEALVTAHAQAIVAVVDCIVHAWLVATCIEAALQNPFGLDINGLVGWIALWGLAMNTVASMVLFVSVPMHHAGVVVVDVVVVSLSLHLSPGEVLGAIFVVMVSLVLIIGRRRQEITSRTLFLMDRQLRKAKLARERIKYTRSTQILGLFSRNKTRPDSNPPWLVDEGDIEYIRPLGSGSYGEVMLALSRGNHVAVKSIVSAKAGKASNLHDFLGEVHLLSELRHPNIVLFMGACFDSASGKALLLTEFMNCGSLFDLLHRSRGDVDRRQLGTRDKLTVLSQAAAGLAYLHSMRPVVIHGDLKTANILLDDRLNAKLADFGMSLFVASDGAVPTEGGTTRASTAAEMSPKPRYGRGTLIYAAPEVLAGKAATKASDIFSLAVVLWEVVVEEIPHAQIFSQCGSATLATLVLSQNLRPEVEKLHASPDYIELVQLCWAKEPERRLSADKLRKALEDELERLGAPESGWSGSQSQTYKMSRVESVETGTHVALAALEVCGRDDLWVDRPTETKRALREFGAGVLREQLRAHGGYVLWSEPGLLFAGFPRPSRALAWALAMQLQAPAGQLRMQLRIGLHFGDPEASVPRRTGGTEVLTTRMWRSFSGTMPAKTLGRAVAIGHAGEVIASDQFVSSTGQPEDFDLLLGAEWKLRDMEGFRQICASTASFGEPLSGEAQELVGIEGLAWELDLGDIHFFDQDTDTVLMGTSTRKGDLMGALVSVKSVLLDDEQMVLSFYEHCSRLYTARHPAVAQFVGARMLSPSLGVAVSIWLPQSLRDFLVLETDDIVAHHLVPIARGVCQGMAFLHGIGLVHRTLSVTNIYLDEDFAAKVGDVPMAVGSRVAATQTGVDSIAIAAPEVLAGGRPTSASDVFLFAFVLYEMVQRRPAFEAVDATVLAGIAQGLRPVIERARVSRAIVEMLQACWAPRAGDRPNFADLDKQLESIMIAAPAPSQLSRSFLLVDGDGL